MKKTYLTSLLIFFSISTFVNSAAAQSKTSSIYLDLGGPAGLYSLNYDMRFQKSVEGWGARAGVSYFALDGESLIAVPVQINYLLGEGSNYLELGVGATFTHNKDDDYDSSCGCLLTDTDELYSLGSDLFGTLTFGYRRQPVDGGFVFRIGLSPMFNEEYFQLFYPYLSFGVSF